MPHYNSNIKAFKTFDVILSRSYIVKVKAENEKKAKGIAEFFTGNIKDLSNAEHRKKYKFKIIDIDCKVNEAIQAEEAGE